MTTEELETLLEIAEREQTHKWSNWADWTNVPQKVKTNPSMSAIPTQPIRQEMVNGMITMINYLNLNYTIGHLENYYTRMYNTDTGVESAEWLRDEFIRLSQNSSLNVSVDLWGHTWDQPSVIAIIDGDGSTDEIVVMGAHLDSTSNTQRAPGADDDGCGVATIMEMFRVLIDYNNFRPKRAIHFMLYAAEEVGLRGSTDIASTYGGDDVYAVYQSEMCGWRGTLPDIALIDDDYTDPDLVDFSEALIDEYCIYPARRDSCGYACSDHASWDRVGARSVCTAEAGPSGDLNPHYHRSTDLLEHIDTQYASDFVKFGLGFAVELSLAN